MPIFRYNPTNIFTVSILTRPIGLVEAAHYGKPSVQPHQVRRYIRHSEVLLGLQGNLRYTARMAKQKHIKGQIIWWSVFKKHLKFYIPFAIILLYIISLITPVISPFTQFPLFLVKCGGLPVVATDFAAAYTYDKPGDRFYSVSYFTSHYFCNESEAQAAGYRHNVLNEPVLGN